MITVCKTTKEKALRKRPSQLSFAMFDSIAQVDPVMWNRLAGHELFMTVEYLQGLENNPPSNMKFRYAVMYNGKKPAGIACFQLVEFTGESFGTLVYPEGSEKKKGVRESIKDFLKKNAEKVSVRMLIAGNAFSSGQHGFVFNEEVEPAEAFRALADVVYRISRADKLHGKVNAVLIKDFFSDMERYSSELKQYKYYDLKVEPAMILDLDPSWKSFDDYLGAMSSKYRKRARSVIKKGAAIQVRSLGADEILKEGVRIMELFDAVHLKAKFRLASLTIGYFAEMKRTFGDGFMMNGYYIDGKLVGFRSTFVVHDGVDAHFVGLDYGVNREHDVYQNMLYDFVKDTFAAGKKRLYLGRTASEIKSTIGARPYELYCYVRHRNPLHNRFIKPFISQVQPSEWIMRNPFKEE